MYFNANLEALSAERPGIRALLEASRHLLPEAEIVSTPSGDPALMFQGRYITARRDPRRDAQRIIERRFPKPPDVAVFLHFGLGYEIEAFQALHSESDVVLLEPDIPLFIKALEARELCTTLSSPRLSLLLDSAPALLGELLDDRQHVSIELFPLTAAARLHPEYQQQTEEWFRRFRSRREINRNTLQRFGRIWVRNLIKNMGELKEVRPLVELENLLKGYPCLVLAAGPSLDLIVPFIKELRERMAIIAVDTSAAWCSHNGIQPDFLVVVDPQYWNTRHLDILKGPQVLISESSTHPAVFRHLKGVRYFGSSLFPLGHYLERPIGITGTLGAGGSVATTAWDLARYLGAGTIYCAGLDLGYPEMKTHYRGSLFEELSHFWADRINPSMTQHFRVVRDGAPIVTESVDGGSVTSDRRLSLYRWWFENRMAEPASPPTYTLSTGGVRIEGMHAEDPATLLDLPEIRPELSKLLPTPEKPKVNGNGETSARQNAIRGGLRQLETAMLELAEYCSSALAHIESEMPLKERIEALQDIDQKILVSGAKDIAGFLLDTRREFSRDPLEASRELYQELLDSIEFHRALIQQVL